MKTTSRSSAQRQPKRDALFRETRHDAYQARRKPVSPGVCPRCKALFLDGRWRWAEAPGSTLKQTCPACKRIADDFPAGYVTLKGEYFDAHRWELLHLVHHHEARERQEHPLQRIMKITDTTDGTLITTTDVRLARGIGDALHNSHHGTLDYHYNPQQTLIRVQWER